MTPLDARAYLISRMREFPGTPLERAAALSATMALMYAPVETE